MVDIERTTHATRLPPRGEHEMLDDQLAAPVWRSASDERDHSSLRKNLLIHHDPGRCRRSAPSRSRRRVSSFSFFSLAVPCVPLNPFLSRHDFMPWYVACALECRLFVCSYAFPFGDRSFRSTVRCIQLNDERTGTSGTSMCPRPSRSPNEQRKSADNAKDAHYPEEP